MGRIETQTSSKKTLLYNNKFHPPCYVLHSHCCVNGRSFRAVFFDSVFILGWRKSSASCPNNWYSCSTYHGLSASPSSSSDSFSSCRILPTRDKEGKNRIVITISGTLFRFLYGLRSHWLHVLEFIIRFTK